MKGKHRQVTFQIDADLLGQIRDYSKLTGKKIGDVLRAGARRELAARIESDPQLQRALKLMQDYRDAHRDDPT